MRCTKILALLGCLSLLSTAAWAKKNNPNIALVYSPTTAVAEASSTPSSAMRGVSVALLLSDERASENDRHLGSRTDDDDRRFDLQATNDVIKFLEDSLEKQARQWGYSVADAGDAGVVLVGRVMQFEVEETNQAVGASYNAECTIELELRDRAGKSLWSSSVYGDASRYGKKFSSENTNEVLSDALSEAFAQGLNDAALRDAWGGGEQAAGGRSGSGKPAAPMTPEKALSEVESLMAKDFGEETLIDYLKGRRLTRAMGADDLAKWKDAGVPESVIRVAATLRVE
ncbi:MAG: YajG family lipoprotein [Acidobacteriota bacterium]